MRRPNGQTIFFGSASVGFVVLVVYLALSHNNGQAGAPTPPIKPLSLTNSPFDGQRSYQYLKDLCAIGPRPSGSEGMRQQQKLLTEYFSSLGADVRLQEFDVRHPLDGSRVTMGNLIVQWHPARMQRILLCAHYDTRPFPDEDPRNKKGVFIGANDGASGAALLMELGRLMGDFESRYGIDFVLFDGEELVYDPQRDPYFLGSTHFAQTYIAQPPPYQYRYGVLLDMVADADLQIYQELNSLRYARPLVRDIWATAKKLGVREFIQRSRHLVRDDHLPLNNIAKIPTCDIIDFDYPSPRARQKYWHTEADIPENCSADSLAKVGWVIYSWLSDLQ